MNEIYVQKIHTSTVGTGVFLLFDALHVSRRRYQKIVAEVRSRSLCQKKMAELSPRTD
jgi:hypothetical protein